MLKKKTAQSLPYILDILVDIPQVGGDLITYPKNFTNNIIGDELLQNFGAKFQR